MTELINHVVMAVMISLIISGTLSTVFNRIEANLGRSLTGNMKLVLTIIISVVISFGYTSYYAQLPLNESVAIFVIVALGPQAIYEVIGKNQGGN